MQKMSNVLDLNHRERPLFNEPEYYLGVKNLDDNIINSVRHRYFGDSKPRFQCYSNYWNLFLWKDLKPGEICIRFSKQSFFPVGTVYIYVPAFTLIEWIIKPGYYHYEAFSSYSNIEGGLPEKPLIFPKEEDYSIKGFSDIYDLLNTKKEFCETAHRKKSYVAETTKLFFDHYFVEKIDMADVASEIKIPYPTMISGFKDHFGLTPVAYRNTLRAFEALRLIKNGSAIMQAGLDAGFSSMTRFNQNFHKVFNKSPSSFSHKYYKA